MLKKIIGFIACNSLLNCTT